MRFDLKTSFLAEYFKPSFMKKFPIFVDFISFNAGVYYLKEKFSAKIYRVNKDQLVQKFESGDVNISFLNNYN